ncbi:Relaxin-3 [Lonchura striata]|uniref:Relaxin-3 n=1 Tax=Lonchura striata TaxID=40157 RepID=A0A218VA63_9PASE|nr:Relaxin-3 [Lonchura striata domestica]
MAKLRVLCAAVALLCAAPPGHPGAVLPAGEGDGYGVKLCGREFIRAVIFTCGGSRWKRLSLLAAEPAAGLVIVCNNFGRQAIAKADGTDKN